MGTWKFDPMHTQVEFSAKHLGMMTVRGHFNEVAASGEIYPDDPGRSQVEAVINTASIRTHNEIRDNDLRSSNFLEIAKFPTITFKSTKIEHVRGDRYAVTGELTIKDTTRLVTLELVKYGEFNDPRMGHRIGYAAETKINRKDFGMSFNAVLDGKFVVSDEIRINIEGEIVEAADEPVTEKQPQEAGRQAR